MPTLSPDASSRLVDKKKDPLFSIIIPTFNSADTVLGAIESVRSQSRRSEIWVIDGSSTDDTIRRVESAAFSNVRTFSEPDRGIYDAINKGISRCCGDLIGVLGSDDRYAPEAFANIARAWETSDVAVLAGSTRFCFPDGTNALRPDEPYGLGSLISGIPFGHNAMFATPEAYELVGDYDLRYKICADANWVHRAIRAGLPCRVIPEVVVDFGMSGLSSTSDDAIMAETFATICSNFDGLTPAEARTLLFAARRWAPPDGVASIVRRVNHQLLLESVTAALPELASGDRRKGLGRWLEALRFRLGLR